MRRTAALRDHRAALDYVLRWLVSPEAGVPGIAAVGDIHAVGHRTVHGGEKFTRSVVIDDEVVDQIEDCIDLAPLHNPANLKGIYAARELLGPGVPQVAVFDTSFHSTMPEVSYLYAIPYPLYVRHKIRRYGFHGTSHRYVAYRYRILTGKSYDETNIITVHLGNGCSACAIQKGESINTSMGLTPLEGLVMGTRGGNIDPSILEFLHHKEGMSFQEIDALLNKQSGLLGVSGLTNDMRELLEEERVHQDRRARLAVEIFCLRVEALPRLVPRADERCRRDRVHRRHRRELGRDPARVCQDMDFLGIAVDPAKNEAAVGGKEGDVSAEGARVRTFVIPTNEELLIARDTVRCVKNAPRRW